MGWQTILVTYTKYLVVMIVVFFIGLAVTQEEKGMNSKIAATTNLSKGEQCSYEGVITKRQNDSAELFANCMGFLQ